jgi:anti-sigma regulatory factor (Ser/Thr protein kinase)
MAGVELVAEPVPYSVPTARRWLMDALGPQSPYNQDIARLLLSEILTNAILHARSAVVVRAIETGDRLRIEVADHGVDGRPDPRPRLVPTNLSEDGRGLQVVDMLADSWGVASGDHGETVVWFELTPAERSSYSTVCDVGA